MRNIFVTAIGTDSGKTVVSAILAKALNADYWKPVQSGQPADSETVKQLTAGTVKIHPEQYVFKTPASPHYAAALENRTIDLDIFAAPKTDRPLIIEGAGGLMVPLNEHHLMIDLVKKLNCRVVLVSNIYLGSINHTLLSIEALKKRGIAIDYLVFNGIETPSTENIIKTFTQAPVLFRLDQEEKINPEIIDKYAANVRTLQFH
jgi:dethiobiotin synthetase